MWSYTVKDLKVSAIKAAEATKDHIKDVKKFAGEVYHGQNQNG